MPESPISDTESPELKRYTAITCSALARSVYAAAAGSSNIITVQLLDQGLHNAPKNLRGILQAQIDTIHTTEKVPVDAILLVYGMCGTSTVGLTARDIPLIMPRAHDCITLYLGSGARYAQEFNDHPGTYWYSQDYMERNTSGNNVGLGAANLGLMENLYDEYVQKFGEDNADYLMEVMGEWGKHYDRAVYIDTGMGDGPRYGAMAREQAERRGWIFERKEGNRRLIDKLINGQWTEDEFLIVPPGHTILQAPGDGLVQASASVNE